PTIAAIASWISSRLDAFASKAKHSTLDSTATAGPSGATKPAAGASARRRSVISARHPAMYTTIRVLVASVIAERNELATVASHTSTALARIATCGVLNFGWTRASTAGMSPSSANANGRREVARNPLFSEPSMMTTAPSVITCSPVGPHKTTAASANGAVLVANAGTAAMQTICTPAFRISTINNDNATANGTSRRGLRVSPAATSAASNPTKAKMPSSIASLKSAAGGNVAGAAGHA